MVGADSRGDGGGQRNPLSEGRLRCRPMNRTVGTLFTAVALLLCSAPLSRATTLLRQDLSALVQSSDLIVHGNVHSMNSRWSSDHRRIVTDVELDVVEALKGSPSSRVTVLQPGGDVGDIGQRVEGLAAFDVGEEVFLFLQRHGTERYRVSGMAQGKFHIERSPAGTAIAVPERLHGALVLDPITGQPTTPNTQSMDLESLRQAVRTLLSAPSPAGQKAQP
jgi:hypothetical protein